MLNHQSTVIGNAESSFNRDELLHKLNHLQVFGDRIERTLRNSVPIKMLIDQESKGIGHLTITDLLDTIQSLYNGGDGDSYEDINNRRKPLNPPKSNLQKENETYRQLLQHMMTEFGKKSSGYRVWAEVIRIQLERIDNNQFDQ